MDKAKGKTKIYVVWVTGGPQPPQAGGPEVTNWAFLPASALPLFLITYLPPPSVVPSQPAAATFKSVLVCIVCVLIVCGCLINESSALLSNIVI